MLVIILINNINLRFGHKLIKVWLINPANHLPSLDTAKVTIHQAMSLRLNLAIATRPVNNRQHMAMVNNSNSNPQLMARYPSNIIPLHTEDNPLTRLHIPLTSRIILLLTPQQDIQTRIHKCKDNRQRKSNGPVKGSGRRVIEML